MLAARHYGIAHTRDQPHRAGDFDERSRCPRPRYDERVQYHEQAREMPCKTNEV